MNMDTVSICDLVINDPVAIQRWNRVVDRLVKSPLENTMIKKLMATSNSASFEQAVINSLNIWREEGSRDISHLATILTELDLNSLAGEILRQRGCARGVWFEVREPAYNFTGRRDELKTLYAKAICCDGISNIICIRGLGGVGKSSLVQQYIFTYRSLYDNVIWINADSVESIQNSFIRLAKYLQMDIDGLSSERLASNLFEVLRPKKCLFVYDNIRQRAHFSQFKPTNISSDRIRPIVLVTTRKTNLKLLHKYQIDLDVLSMEDAIEFTMMQLPAITSTSARELATKLQQFPLALQQAVSFIQNKYIEDNECISKYLTEFDNPEKNVLDYVEEKEEGERTSDLNPNQPHSMTTSTVWEVTLKEIEGIKGGESALKCIRILSYLNPENISRDFLSILSSSFENESEMSLHLLHRFSMISVNSQKVKIHRLVQHVIRQRMSSKQRKELMGFIQLLLEQELNKLEFSEFVSECMSHGLHLFTFQLKYADDLMKNKFSYYSRLCFYLMVNENYLDAQSLAHHCIQIYQQIDRDECESTLDMKWRLASALYCQGDLQGAQAIIQPIIKICKSKLGADHRLTMDILVLMAVIQSGMGNYLSALANYDQVIPLFEKLYADNKNVSFLDCKQGKAFALWKTGNPDDAINLLQDAHEELVALFGCEDLDALQVKQGIAEILHQKGELKKALNEYTDVYLEIEKVRGDKHEETIALKQKIDEIIYEISNY